MLGRISLDFAEWRFLCSLHFYYIEPVAVMGGGGGGGGGGGRRERERRGRVITEGQAER